MTDQKYILKGKEVVPATLEEWDTWFEKGDRIIQQNEFVKRHWLFWLYEVKVSTVFLGLDHNWGDGPPLLFETMIFGGKHDQYQERYSTYEEAEAGHEEALKLIN